MSTPSGDVRYRPLRFGVTRAVLREGAGGTQYLVPKGEALARALAIAERVAQNAPLTNYALMHALPRIAEQPADQGYFTEALMSAIVQSAHTGSPSP